MLETFQNKKDRSLTLLHGEAASSSVENAGLAYQAPSLLAVGGAAKDVALLSTATNLIFALLLVKIPSLIKSGDSLKKATIILALISAVAWLPLILVPLLVPSISVAVLIPLWVISLIPALLIGPVRDKWMSDLLPISRIGRYFGLRQIVAAGSYLTTFYLMGYLMDSSKVGMNNVFVVVFTIAFLGSLVSLLLYLAIRHSDVHSQDSGNGFGLLDFLHEIKQNNMATFMLYVTLVTFAASISGAFFSVYMLQDLHFSYLTYTLIISIEFLARMISLTVWGKVVDNTGAIKLMKVISFVIPIIPVLWLFSANLYFLGIVQFVSGVAWAAFDLCNQTHICSASPISKRLYYIVYQRCVITIASAVGPLVGAYLLNRIFPVFGNPILSIFLLSGAMRFIVVIALVFKLRSADSEKPSEEPTPSAVLVMYQFEPKPVSVREQAFPKFEREQPARLKLGKVSTLRPVAALRTEIEPNISGQPQSNTPYRQVQYAAYRDAAAGRLKSSAKNLETKKIIHRLAYPDECPR
jgi:hypothetical protein